MRSRNKNGSWNAYEAQRYIENWSGLTMSVSKMSTNSIPATLHMARKILHLLHIVSGFSTYITETQIRHCWDLNKKMCNVLGLKITVMSKQNPTARTISLSICYSSWIRPKSLLQNHWSSSLKCKMIFESCLNRRYSRKKQLRAMIKIFVSRVASFRTIIRSFENCGYVLYS